MTRRLLLAAALTIPLVGAAAVAPTAATPLPQANTCSGVWVVVDYGPLGGTSTRCASAYGTGTAALKSAGFSPTLDNGMVTKISGKPSKPDINKEYWSYWHASVDADGSFGAWSYSNLGAGSYHPKKGDAEGWRYQSLSEGKVAPKVAPPAAEPAASPTPKPTKATSKPKPTATKPPSVKATPKATPTVSTSTSPRTSPTPSAAVTPVASAPETSVPAPTPLPANEVTAMAQDEAAPPEPTSGSGSPIGLIVAGCAVVAAGAGLGGWWLRRGRNR